ncbi:MAG TPA: RHS repeat-associated core domain-containing protein [bacterium]|nr:RHS repeat-associated core domain-containing protein [bacterium]
MNLSNATHPPQHLGRGNPDPTAFGYDPAGRRVAFDSPALSAAYTYDDIDRLSAAAYQKTSPIPSLTDEDYSYDPDGNRVASHLSDPAPAPAAEFNLRNQIIRDHLFEYRYDLNGNLTHKYLRETCASSRAQDVHSPCLDESSSEATPSFLFSHDEDNKMTAAHNIPQSLSIAIRYDPLGRRFHTKTYLSSGSVPPVHILWRAFDGDDAFADFTTGPAPIPDPDVIGSSPAPALANLYLHGPGVDEPLAWWSLWTDSSGSHRLKPVLLLADGLGSITGLTANADYPAAPKPVQGLASSYHYDSFGNQVRHCDAPAAETSGSTFKLARLNPYRFAAREWLSLDWSATSALGLSDNRARFYDPTLASFLQEDPVWNSNPYTYVGNNPLDFSDPDGENKIREKLGNLYIGISKKYSGSAIGSYFNNRAIQLGIDLGKDLMDNPNNEINQSQIKTAMRMAASCSDEEWEMFTNNAPTEGVKNELAAINWNEFRYTRTFEDGSTEVLTGRSGLMKATAKEVTDWLVSSGNWTKSRLALFGFTSEQLQAIMDTLKSLP